MFSTRKYSPLPTSANGPARKRTGAGLTAWKRWALLAAISVAVIFLVFSRASGGSEQQQIYNEESESGRSYGAVRNLTLNVFYFLFFFIFFFFN